MTNSEVLLLIAVILFAVAAVIRIMGRAVDAACVAVGLGCFALSFLIL
jgi:hypothetical protein